MDCSYGGRLPDAALGEGSTLLNRVAVGVDFVDFADVEFADAGFDFGHVANDDPDQVGRLNIFFGDVVGGVGRDGQNFLSEGVVVIVGQRILQNVAVSARKLLDGFKAA